MRIDEYLDNVRTEIENNQYDEKTHICKWYEFLRNAYKYNCAYEKDGYIFISIGNDGDLHTLISDELMTDKFIVENYIPEEIREKYTGYLIMYDTIDNDGYAVLTMKIPTREIPQSARSVNFDLMIEIYKRGYTSTSGMEGLEIV